MNIHRRSTFRGIVMALCAVAMAACQSAPKRVDEAPEPTESDVPAAMLGDWEGVLVAGAQKLALGLHISSDGVSLDVPAQRVAGAKASSVTFADGLLVAEFDAFKASVELRAADSGGLDAIWAQSGARLPLTFARAGGESAAAAPAAPARIGESVRFKSGQAGVELAGTLRLPDGKGPFPCLILVSGSGAQDRDEAIGPITPFRDIAEGMAARGWATLRYDDRGVGESGGTFSGSTSEDFALDALGAYRFAAADSRIDAGRVALAGHSEGGYVIAIAENLIGGVYGLVSIAGPGVGGYEILLDQSRDILAGMGAPAEAIESSQAINRALYDMILASDEFPLEAAKAELSKAGLPPDQLEAQLSALRDPWFKAFLRSNPAEYYSRVRSPVLALNGSKDSQVRAGKNLAAIEAAAAKAGVPVKAVAMEGLNHLFQQANTGMPDEYMGLPPDFSPEAIALIADWLDGIGKR
ncbi:MAG: alpha/beta fold hydrolase [Spirochaetaceae bacterium]|nr:alpha/beta fold hydrolase [Spirochaetaceae bacterium]